MGEARESPRRRRLIYGCTSTCSTVTGLPSGDRCPARYVRNERGKYHYSLLIRFHLHGPGSARNPCNSPLWDARLFCTRNLSGVQRSLSALEYGKHAMGTNQSARRYATKVESRRSMVMRFGEENDGSSRAKSSRKQKADVLRAKPESRGHISR